MILDHRGYRIQREKPEPYRPATIPIRNILTEDIIPAFIDLTEQKFNRLTVIRRDNTSTKTKNRNTKWICKCDCGKITTVDNYKLKNGLIKSCGCFKKDNEVIDLTGQKFGRLKVIKRGKNKSYRAVTWICICDCGNETVVTSIALRTGRTTSCGCYSKEVNLKKNTKHGYAKRGEIGPEYRAWTKIKQRCTNQSDKYWKDYGGRGIKMCKRWLNSFENFYKDMGKRPSKRYSIDRIDNDGDYSPKNCRWATAEQQSNNTRRNILITIDGIEKTREQWCKFYGIDDSTVTWRIKHGWPIKKAFTASPFTRHNVKKVAQVS